MTALSRFSGKVRVRRPWMREPIRSYTPLPARLHCARSHAYKRTRSSAYEAAEVRYSKTPKRRRFFSSFLRSFPYFFLLFFHPGMAGKILHTRTREFYSFGITNMQISRIPAYLSAVSVQKRLKESQPLFFIRE